MSRSRRMPQLSDDCASNPRFFADAETTREIASVEPDPNLSRTAELDDLDRSWAWRDLDED